MGHRLFPIRGGAYVIETSVALFEEYWIAKFWLRGMNLNVLTVRAVHETS